MKILKVCHCTVTMLLVEENGERLQVVVDSYGHHDVRPWDDEEGWNFEGYFESETETMLFSDNVEKLPREVPLLPHRNRTA